MKGMLSHCTWTWGTEWDISFPLLASTERMPERHVDFPTAASVLLGEKNKSKLLSQLPSSFIEGGLGHLCIRLTFKKTKMKCCSWIHQFFVATVPPSDILSSRKKQKWSYLEILSTLLFLPVPDSNKWLGLWYWFWGRRNLIYTKCISLLQLILCLPKSCFNYIQQSICIHWVSDLLSKTHLALSSWKRDLKTLQANARETKSYWSLLIHAFKCN